MTYVMRPEEVLAAAKQNDANTAEALKAAQEAVKSLVALKGDGIFGSSPAGKATDQVFGQASGVIDDLITEVNRAITVLNENLHASVDAVLKDQEVAQVDYTRLTRDNQQRSTTIDGTGLKPGDPGYAAPAGDEAYAGAQGQGGSPGGSGGSPGGSGGSGATSGSGTTGTTDPGGAGGTSDGSTGATGGTGGAS